MSEIHGVETFGPCELRNIKKEIKKFIQLPNVIPISISITTPDALTTTDNHVAIVLYEEKNDDEKEWENKLEKQNQVIREVVKK